MSSLRSNVSFYFGGVVAWLLSLGAHVVPFWIHMQFLGQAKVGARDTSENTHYKPKFNTKWATCQLQLFHKVECNLNIFQVNWWGAVSKLAPVSMSKIERIKSLISVNKDEWNATPAQKKKHGGWTH